VTDPAIGEQRQKSMNCYWLRCSEHDLAALRKASRGVAVLPLGSIESHGPHLPLGNDTLCVEHLVERVVARETVAVLPPLSYSAVAEARPLPGALHIRSEALMGLVEALGDEVHRNGFEKIVLLHAHGGNVALHTMFLKRVLEREKPYAVYSIPVFGGQGGEIGKLLETKEWGHACEMETSLSLVAAPDLVQLKRLGRTTFPTRRGPSVGAAATPVGWICQHPEMAVGQPQKATKQKGEAIFALWADEVVAILRKIKRDRTTPAAMRAYARNAHSHRARK